jgi:hypothetical protein
MRRPQLRKPDDLTTISRGIYVMLGLFYAGMALFYGLSEGNIPATSAYALCAFFCGVIWGQSKMISSQSKLLTDSSELAARQARLLDHAATALQKPKQVYHTLN